MLVERVAGLTDISFISSCILYGARKGHYSLDAENPDMVKAMKKEVRSLVIDGLLQDGRRASASIFTHLGERVGTLIMCESAPNATSYEIYTMSVTKRHQNKGFGGQIIGDVITRFAYEDVLARCLPVSGAMKNLLKRHSFVFYDEDGEYEIYIKGGFDYSGHVAESTALGY